MYSLRTTLCEFFNSSPRVETVWIVLLTCVRWLLDELKNHALWVLQQVADRFAQALRESTEAVPVAVFGFRVYYCIQLRHER